MRALRDIRLRRGFSQADLSAATGVAEYTISEIEAGKRTARPSTLRKLAQGLDVEVADLYGEPTYPLAEAPPARQPSLNDALEEGRRIRPWITYVSRRVEWCEEVVERTPADEWNNPWLTLETAIQWAIYVSMESSALRDIVNTEVLPYADNLTDEADELRTLVDRFRAVENQTDERVKAMMEEAGLREDEKRARFKLIHGQRSA